MKILRNRISSDESIGRTDIKPGTRVKGKTAVGKEITGIVEGPGYWKGAVRIYVDNPPKIPRRSIKNMHISDDDFAEKRKRAASHRIENITDVVVLEGDNMKIKKNAGEAVNEEEKYTKSVIMGVTDNHEKLFFTGTGWDIDPKKAKIYKDIDDAREEWDTVSKDKDNKKKFVRIVTPTYDSVVDKFPEKKATEEYVFDYGIPYKKLVEISERVMDEEDLAENVDAIDDSRIVFMSDVADNMIKKYQKKLQDALDKEFGKGKTKLDRVKSELIVKSATEAVSGSQVDGAIVGGGGGGVVDVVDVRKDFKEAAEKLRKLIVIGDTTTGDGKKVKADQINIQPDGAPNPAKDSEERDKKAIKKANESVSTDDPVCKEAYSKLTKLRNRCSGDDDTNLRTVAAECRELADWLKENNYGEDKSKKVANEWSTMEPSDLEYGKFMDDANKRTLKIFDPLTARHNNLDWVGDILYDGKDPVYKVMKFDDKTVLRDYKTGKDLSEFSVKTSDGEIANWIRNNGDKSKGQAYFAITSDSGNKFTGPGYSTLADIDGKLTMSKNNQAKTMLWFKTEQEAQDFINNLKKDPKRKANYQVYKVTRKRSPLNLVEKDYGQLGKAYRHVVQESDKGDNMKDKSATEGPIRFNQDELMGRVSNPLGSARKRSEDEDKAAAAAAEKERLREKYSGIIGKIQEGLDSGKTPSDVLQGAFDDLVPPSGPAETEAGEAVRAMMRILYRDWNDGDVFYEGYGLETVAPSVEYLGEKGLLEEDWVRSVAEDQLEGEEYTKELESWARFILHTLVENPELFERKNEEDSRDWEIENILEMQPTYDMSIDYSDKLNRLYDAGEISQNNIRNYVQDMLSYDHILKDAEVEYVNEMSVDISGLTRDGLDELEDWTRDIDRFWSDLTDDYDDPDDDGDDSADEAYSNDDKLTIQEFCDQMELTRDHGSLLMDRLDTDDWDEEKFSRKNLIDAMNYYKDNDRENWDSLFEDWDDE